MFDISRFDYICNKVKIRNCSKLKLYWGGKRNIGEEKHGGATFVFQSTYLQFFRTHKRWVSYFLSIFSIVCVPSITHDFDYLRRLCLNGRERHVTTEKSGRDSNQPVLNRRFEENEFRATNCVLGSWALIHHVQIKTSASINTLSVSL